MGFADTELQQWVKNDDNLGTRPKDEVEPVHFAVFEMIALRRS